MVKQLFSKKTPKKAQLFWGFLVSESTPAARRLARGVPPLAGVLARRAAKLRRRAVLGGGKGEGAWRRLSSWRCSV